MLAIAVEVIIKGVILISLLMLAAAYMTLMERVLMARMQLRLGPNRVGPLGLFQPIADGIKLFSKESFRPANIDHLVYWLAPGIALFTALFAFALIPFGGAVTLLGRTIELRIADVNAGIVFFLAFSSLAVYGITLAGWSSNNRYSLIGGLRSTAQMISYEIPMGISVLTVILAAETLDFNQIIESQREHWFIWTHPVSFIIYLITIFAETNRAPFDLPEAEHELVGGYNTEYGGMKFAIFFLGEYVNMLAVSAIAVTLFFGGWLGPWDIPVLWFAVKVAIFIFFFMWVRATMPRFRYGQLMDFSWKILLPIAVLNFVITAYFTLVIK